MKYDTKILGIGYDTIIEASELLKKGEIVAIPTETVYGLAANALNIRSVKKIFTAKGRPSDNPLIVHIYDQSQVSLLAKDVSEKAKQLMDEFWPGPLTLVLHKKKAVSDVITGGLDTVAIRMPAHPVAFSILEECQLPLAAPSANISGKPSPTSAQQVFEDLEGRIPIIVDGGSCDIGLESTVLDVSVDPPCILRPGAVTREMIAELIGEVSMDEAVLDPLKKGAVAKSPGVKHRHYAPDAEIEIVKGTDIAVSRYVNRAILKDNVDGISAVVLCCQEHAKNYPFDKIILGSVHHPESIAENLFNSLREIDKGGYKKAYVQYYETEGLNAAIMNRLLKAANHNVIDVG
ncbi:MAG: threonylcarbamoyl-AMP synthase [Clostridia bacterium]|nr:threonylcarbamoyl-AMP synthase [Clostridia bacterium]